jgi:hypothetical protein
VELEVATVQEQVVELHRREGSLGPGLELDLDGLADPADGRLGQGSLGSERIGQRRLDVAHRQTSDEPGDDERLECVGPADAYAQQTRSELLVGVAQLRPLQGHGPGRGLDRRRAVAVAAALAISIPAGVTLTAQELGDLGLERGLHQQANSEAGNVFEDVAEVPVGSEQLVDVGADALDGRYSGGRGCGSPS